MKPRTISLILVIIVIVGGILYFESLKVTPSKIKDMGDIPDVSIHDSKTDNMPVEMPTEETERIALKETMYPHAPDLAGIEGYLNSEGEEFQVSDFKGKVVLIDFWTYTCINCIRTLPHLTGWHEKYVDKGLVIIGVHTPEFEFEKDTDNVLAAMEKHGVEYLVAQDNNYQTWRNYQNRFWPHKFLIDGDGFIRYDHIGEGAYIQTEEVIQMLLEELGEDTSDIEPSTLEDLTPRIRTTPELYAGFDFNLPRGQNVGNAGGLQPHLLAFYTLPDTIQSDVIYLDGTWASNADDLRSDGEASIILNYQASNVNIVMDSEETVELDVFVDEEYVTEEFAGDDVQFDGDRAYVEITGPQLYNVVSGENERHTLRLTSLDSFSFNAFTFG